MKAAAFKYQRPQTLDEALSLIADPALESRIIAGGQTLVPLMATRLATPDRLIDIARIEELSNVALSASALSIGAMTRQATAQHDRLVEAHVPLLTEALPWVGHQQTRNRGTLGGSICHADPAAEIPLVATVLDASFLLSSVRGSRAVKAEAFFKHALVTAIEADECLVRIDFPRRSRPNDYRSGVAFEEMNIRSGDFALVAAAVQLDIGADGYCASIACGVGGAAPRPVRAVETEQALSGSRLADAEIEEAVRLVSERLAPDEDIHASAQYRDRVARALLKRALCRARDRAAMQTGN